jgi:hypothetical protein
MLVNCFYTPYQCVIMQVNLCYWILAACQVVAFIWFLDIVFFLSVTKRCFPTC